MNTSIQTKQEQQADMVLAILLGSGIALLIAFFVFILPNVTRDPAVDAYIRVKENQEIRDAHNFQMKQEAEQNKQYITVKP
ncbi:hypothetical protein HZP37_18145 [Elizabethkingia anophelis]|nr:hypothetical protein [Elizabethkingia anophelis]